ncbi:TPA: DeoR/GlpR family DNA-binding transcription regulator [Streptococcus pneumoniae]
MIKDERVLELIEIIKKKKRIAVKELAEITFSSTSTLRRDLIFLENQGLIKRKHGYVTLSSMNTIELSHQIREGESTRQKRLIASLAKDFIRSGMCIYLDSSTTVYELCPYLSELDNLIIFTNGLHTAQTLSETVKNSSKIFITSGEVKHQSCSVVNYDKENSLLDHFNIDLAFCSARGIDDQYVYEASLSQAISKKNIIDKAHETILLIDSSKFYKTGFFKINPLSKYTTFISDTLPNQKLLDAVELFDGEWVSDIQ